MDVADCALPYATQRRINRECAVLRKRPSAILWSTGDYTAVVRARLGLDTQLPEAEAVPDETVGAQHLGLHRPPTSARAAAPDRRPPDRLRPTTCLSTQQLSRLATYVRQHVLEPVPQLGGGDDAVELECEARRAEVDLGLDEQVAHLSARTECYEPGAACSDSDAPIGITFWLK